MINIKKEYLITENSYVIIKCVSYLNVINTYMHYVAFCRCVFMCVEVDTN